ncbi:MAG: hypothetical protein H6821_03845 [Planctomycetaceae bacterium]|nr:hypothetical protein [Planctomycetales bacterium]MCB9873290.1 hypothetical protein [Planctomycetaceae bacterium]MCB9938711.1 hypothetical protein [Planctomycetaceae bacterium]HRX77783.1 hypothetical protein [Pirellulaceae bacterium]
MKLPHILLLTGVVLMAAAFAVPLLFGGRAALHGELEAELVTAGELHMATAHSHDDSQSATAHSPEEELQHRIDAALNRGQTTASVLKWVGIGVAFTGIVMLTRNRSRKEGK